MHLATQDPEIENCLQLWTNLVKEAQLEAPRQGSRVSHRKIAIIIFAGLVLCAPAAVMVDPHLFMGIDRDYYFMVLVVASTVGVALMAAPMLAGITGHYTNKKVVMDKLTAMLTMESAVRGKLPYLMLVDRANAQAWIEMRHGVKTCAARPTRVV
jgi:hypothetical protein